MRKDIHHLKGMLIFQEVGKVARILGQNLLLHVCWSLVKHVLQTLYDVWVIFTSVSTLKGEGKEGS